MGKPLASVRDAEIGNRLRRRRLRLGLTQQQFADALGVSYQQTSKYEAGTNRVSATRLADACRVLGLWPTGVLRNLPANGQLVEVAERAENRKMLELTRLYVQLPEPLQRAVLDLVRAQVKSRADQ